MDSEVKSEKVPTETDCEEVETEAEEVKGKVEG